MQKAWAREAVRLEQPGLDETIALIGRRLCWRQAGQGTLSAGGTPSQRGDSFERQMTSTQRSSPAPISHRGRRMSTRCSAGCFSTEMLTLRSPAGVRLLRRMAITGFVIAFGIVFRCGAVPVGISRCFTWARTSRRSIGGMSAGTRNEKPYQIRSPSAGACRRALAQLCSVRCSARRRWRAQRPPAAHFRAQALAARTDRRVTKRTRSGWNCCVPDLLVDSAVKIRRKNGWSPQLQPASWRGRTKSAWRPRRKRERNKWAHQHRTIANTNTRHRGIRSIPGNPRRCRPEHVVPGAVSHAHVTTRIWGPGTAKARIICPASLNLQTRSGD